MEYVEPLEPAAWFGALQELAKEAESAPSEAEERLLRHAYHLLQLTPRPLRGVVQSDLRENQCEQWLECEAYVAVAIALAGFRMKLSLIRLGETEFQADVGLPGQEQPTVWRSSKPALAIAGAWARCLVALGTRSLEPTAESPHPGRRKARPVPHLQLIEP